MGPPFIKLAHWPKTFLRSRFVKMTFFSSIWNMLVSQTRRNPSLSDAAAGHQLRFKKRLARMQQGSEYRQVTCPAASPRTELGVHNCRCNWSIRLSHTKYTPILADQDGPRSSRANRFDGCQTAPFVP